MLLHLMGNEFDEETIKENYAYYEKRTLHGSSLSPSIFSVMGLKVGDDSKAYRYLRRAAFIDLLNMQGNTREGIHAANTGGVWQTIVFGFAGVAQREDGMLKVHPNMPKEWQGLTFRLHYRGAWLEITADGSNQAKVIRLAGEPVEAEINGKVTTIEKETGGYMMKKWLAIGGLILVTVIWGGGFVASDMALGSMKPFQIMMVRFLLASVLMGMISMGQHKKEGKLENRAGAIKAGILMGIALFAGFALQIIGLQYTTPSKNAFLTALNVVIVPFIAFIILKKKVGMKGIIGAIMSVIGVALLSLNGNLTLSLGDGLTLLCAVGFAFQIFFTGEFVKKYPASVLNMVQMITAFVLSAVSLVIFGENDFQVTTQGWLSVLYLGVISTTVCYLLQTACQKYVDETKAAIVLSMESVFGTIFSIIILHEVITLRMVIGCATILAAVIISNLSETEGEAKDEEIQCSNF